MQEIGNGKVKLYTIYTQVYMYIYMYVTYTYIYKYAVNNHVPLKKHTTSICKMNEVLIFSLY